MAFPAIFVNPLQKQQPLEIVETCFRAPLGEIMGNIPVYTVPSGKLT